MACYRLVAIERPQRDHHVLLSRFASSQNPISGFEPEFTVRAVGQSRTFHLQLAAIDKSRMITPYLKKLLGGERSEEIQRKPRRNNSGPWNDVVKNSGVLLQIVGLGRIHRWVDGAGLQRAEPRQIRRGGMP